MKLLIDAVLPATLTTEAPAGIYFERWKKSEQQNDSDLVRYAAKKRMRGVVFFESKSLEQPGLRQLAKKLGVVLVAIDAKDPIQAKERLLRQITRVRSMLNEASFIRVIASDVRAVND